MEIRILGSLEVTGDDGSAIAVGPLKRRILLGILALESGRVVSNDRLVEAIWGEEPPVSALSTLQGLVYQLRQLLGAAVIESTPPGYRLSSSRVNVDIEQLSAMPATSELALVDAALALFRGRPLDDLGDGDVVAAARQLWLDARLRLFERWCDLKLDTDEPADVVERVEQELVDNPWRESLWTRLVVALYKSDRQADALGACTRARRALVEDLGLEPGPALQRLEQQILVHDVALGPVRSVDAKPVPGNVRAVAVRPDPARKSRRVRVGMIAVLAGATVGVVAIARSGESTGSEAQSTTSLSIVPTSGGDQQPSIGSSSTASPTTVAPTITQPISTLAAGLPAPASAPAPTGYTPGLVQRSCAGDVVAAGLTGVECWTLTVPEDRASPARTIDLSVYRIPAKTNPETAPTVIDLGPANPINNNPVSLVANVVAIPSRGFGLSTPEFSCPELSAAHLAALDRPSNDPTSASEGLAALSACRDRLVANQFNLSSYNLDAEISDVTDYLFAAHLDSVFMTSVSIDSPAVLVAADRYPATFRGIYLENPIDPGTSYIADPVNDLSRALSRFAKLCIDDVLCGPAYPNLIADAQATIERLDAAPRDTTVKAFGYQGREYPGKPTNDVGVMVDGGRAVEALLRSLVLPFTYGAIPAALTDLTDARVDNYATFAVGAELGDYGVGAAFHSFECAALPPNSVDGRSSANAIPWLRAAWDSTFLDRCKIWNVKSLPPQFFAPSTGPTPTFIAVGEMDPTPAIPWAQSLQRSRPNTTVISFKTGGAFLAHTLQGPQCYVDLLRKFVLDPTAPLDVDACAAQTLPIDFTVAGP